MDNSDEDTNGSFEFVDKVDELEDEKSESGPSAVNNKSDESKWEDVLGSGNLLKKIIRYGNDIRPERRDICKIKYECRHNGKLIEKVDEIEVAISDSELIQGLDLIIPLMYIGEIAEVKISPRFAYGALGFQDEQLNIPPDATLEYKIELISSKAEPEFENLSVKERAEIGLRKKDKGNWWFRREEYQFAVLCYKRAIEYLDYTENENLDKSVPKTEADQLIDEKINVYNNLSVAQLKMNNIDNAISSADTVLQLQPNNLKAMYRKGKALAEKGERTEALKYFKKTLEIDPANKTAQIESQKIQNLLAADAKSERKLYKNMFQPTKSSKDMSQSTIKSAWIKLGVFIGSLAVAVVGVIIYRFSSLD